MARTLGQPNADAVSRETSQGPFGQRNWRRTVGPWHAWWFGRELCVLCAHRGSANVLGLSTQPRPFEAVTCMEGAIYTRRNAGTGRVVRSPCRGGEARRVRAASEEAKQGRAGGRLAGCAGWAGWAGWAGLAGHTGLAVCARAAGREPGSLRPSRPRRSYRRRIEPTEPSRNSAEAEKGCRGSGQAAWLAGRTGRCRLQGRREGRECGAG